MISSVGTRELKTHLGRYLQLVRSGETLVVTDRGRPVAEIRPIPKEADDQRAILGEMAALGEVTLGSGEAFPPLAPVRPRGKALSATIVEDRADRL